MKPLVNVVLANILAAYAEVTAIELPPFLAWILPVLSAVYSLTQLSVLVISQIQKLKQKRNAKRKRKPRFGIIRPDETPEPTA